MPPVAVVVLKGGAVPRTSYKSAQLHAQRIGLGRERTQRIIANHHTVGIATEFRSGCTVLQIIPAVVFCHPGTFDEGIQKGIVHVLAKTLPAIAPVFEEIHFFSCADRLQSFPV